MYSTQELMELYICVCRLQVEYGECCRAHNVVRHQKWYELSVAELLSMLHNSPGDKIAEQAEFFALWTTYHECGRWIPTPNHSVSSQTTATAPPRT